jgi:oligopeptidase B
MNKTIPLMLLTLVWLAACDQDRGDQMTQPQTEPAANDQPSAPLAERRDHVVSAPGGERVDPWYWLRDDDRSDPDVLAYLEAENAYEQAMLAHLSDLREELAGELRGRIAEDDTTVPWLDRGYWYYTRFEQGHEYPIHVRREGDLDAPEEVLLDVNAKAEDHGFYQVGGWDVSMDGRQLAWLEDTVGRRQHRLMIKDLDSGEITDTGITGVSSLSWSADSDVLYYVENEPETLRSFRVRRYRPSEGGHGKVVYQEDDAAFYTQVSRTKSNAYNFIYLRSTVSSEMHVIEASDTEGEFQRFFPRERDHEYVADHLGEYWIIRTNHRAPNFRIMRVALDRHADRDAWEDVIGHSDDVFIHDFDAMQGFLAVSERSEGLRRVRIHDWDSGESEVLTFDEPAYTAYLGRNADQAASTLRYVYTSMTTPRSTWELDVATGERELLKRDEVPSDFDSADYRTRREWAVARDGTRVPVSILHHRDTPLDGTAPLYQYAYGSYGHSSDPTFATGRLSLVDRGFVFAIAHVRGGQEMGRHWYDDGRMLNKINTFNDFIDVTHHLVERELIDRDRVFAVGGSAGGLLVGAVINKAPEYYRGVVAHVPFVDVVTTMLDESIPLTTNEYDEWGNPSDPEYYDYMLSYSPYDNVLEQDYPAILVTTGLWDSQVQYWEPAKWVARLRAKKTDDNPLLLHTNMSAGHGGASGRFRRLEQTAAEYAFILDQAGLGQTN